MTFYAAVLENVCPAFGWQGGPMGDTEINTQRNQHERRTPRDVARHYYTLPFANITDEAYLAYLKSWHQVMYEQTHSFLVLDWLDHEAREIPLGAAPSGNAPIQLQTAYFVRDRSGSIVASRYRDITKPDADTVSVWQDNGSGVLVLKPGTTDPDTGLFTPESNWVAGRALVTSFDFWVPVRFNNDYLPFTIDNRSGDQRLVNGSVELIEVFGE